jgi:hypothetical protein
MGAGFPLNCDPFEKLLAAAWVLQCEQDAQQNQTPHQLDVIRTVDSATCITQETPDAEDGSALRSDASPVPVERPLPAPELGGSLPSQPLLNHTKSASNSAIIAALHAMANAAEDRAIPQVSRWFSAGLGAIQLGWLCFQPKRVRLIVSKRSLHLARVAAAPILLLSVMFAFSFSQLWKQKAAQASQKTDSHNSQMAAGQSLMQPEGEVKADQTATEFPSSHLRVTDSAAASTVESLSSYEIEGLRRQAEYGDQFAALALGMAYESGHAVHQNCTKAAEWIAFAAANGNPAAQYNLGLRYLHGDGLPQDSAAGAKWLEKAAAAGYPKVFSADKQRSE